MRIENLKRNYDVDLKLVHFPLHPDTPSEGKSMQELYAARGADPDELWKQMKARMDDEGLPYGKRTHTYNSRLAQELGKWAETQEGGDAFHDALYQAYFVDGRNVSDVDVLVDVASSAGLSGEKAREVLETRSFEAAIDADWAKSRQYGVTGVPTFVAAGMGVVGAQPYEMLEKLAVQAGAKRRSAD